MNQGMRTPLRLLSLRLRIWAIEKLGGETEDLSYWLWSLTRPPRDESAGPFDPIMPEIYLHQMMEQMNKRTAAINGFRVDGTAAKIVEWAEDMTMPIIVTSMAQSAGGREAKEQSQEASQK